MAFHAQTRAANTDSPLWSPSRERIENSRIESFRCEAERMTGQNFPDYAALHAWSCRDMAGFYNLAWDFLGVIGDRQGPVLADGAQMPGAKFFPEARINYAENLLRRRDDETALIFRGEDRVERSLSHAELYEEVSRLAGWLKSRGVQEGDRVAGYLPNMPEALIGKLATSAIGAIWCSASPDFGVQGVLDRFGQIEPKVLIACDGYYYNGKTIDVLGKLRDIVPQIPGLEAVLMVSYALPDAGRDGIAMVTEWAEGPGAQAGGDIAFTRQDFNDPLVIMFSSGTTGVPKCIVHSVGGVTLSHMKEHQLQVDIQPGDKVFYFTTTGWMMWNWQISALASGATLLLYDGSPFYPDGNVLFDYADAHGMTFFGTAAKFIDAIAKAGIVPRENHNLGTVRTLGSTGSPLVHESFDYIYRDVKQDLHVSSLSGGTDILGCFVIGNPISPVYRGEIQGSALGMDMDCFDEHGHVLPPGEKGNLVCKKPFPSMPVKFWNDPDGARYHKAYFADYPGVWCHGDWVEKTPNGGWIIHGRADATLNPGGVRIGTAEIYRQVEKVPEVLESLAVGQEWDNDERIVLFIVLREGQDLAEDLEHRIRKQIRSGASPRHVPARIVQIPEIPRTKSGKIVELAVRDVIHGRDVKNKEALANPQALEAFKNRPELES